MPSEKHVVGKVKYFDQTDRYGFFSTDRITDDVFFHVSDMFSDDDVEDIEEGNQFEFDIVNEEKGPRAVNIESLEIE